MRIWLIHLGELVQSDAPHARLYRLGLLAEELEARGHEVVRWIPTFIHTSKSQRFDCDTVVQVSDRHQIRHIFAKGYRRHLGPGRFRFHRQVAHRWERLQRQLPAPDLILTSMPTADICSAARRIGEQRGIPFVIDVRDLWPDVLAEALPSWAAAIARAVSAPMRRSNLRSFHGATAVTGISEMFVDWGVALAGRARSPLDRAFVPGYAPPRVSTDQVAAAVANWRAALRPGAFICLFLGTLSRQFDLSTVIAAARQLEAEEPGRFEWVICGEGPTRVTLQTASDGMGNVHFPGWVGGADIVALLGIASVGLAPYAGSKSSGAQPASRASFAAGLPNKPFEYASAGLPVLSSLHGELGRLISKEQFGMTYSPGDPSALATAVRRYATDSELLAKQGRAARMLWEREISASAVYSQMASHLERISATAAGVAVAETDMSISCHPKENVVTPSTSHATMYRSPLFRAARSVLIAAEHRLPRTAYNALYRGAFSLYRTGIKAGYAAKIKRLRHNGEWQGVRRGEAVTKALPFSLVGPNGLEATYQAVLETVGSGVPGAVVECGVAQGGSSAVMALALRDSAQQRHLWLFDSYEGLPDPTSDDVDPASGATGAHIRPLPKGSCLGTYEEVEHLMSEIIGVPDDQFTMVKGWFQETVTQTADKIGEIAVLRLDGDWYESTRCCLDGLFRQLSPGGMLIVDDYHSCFGAQRAVDEFLAEQGDPEPSFVDDGSGGVLYTKLRIHTVSSSEECH